jgi:hypothetical protein
MQRVLPCGEGAAYAATAVQQPYQAASARGSAVVNAVGHVIIQEREANVNDEAVLRDISSSLKAALSKLSFVLPSVLVECPTNLGSGTLELLIAGWGDGHWVEKSVGILKPGESMNVKLSPILEGTDLKSGQTLLLRSQTKQLPIYKVTNLENSIAIMHTVCPPKYPWWQGTQVVKWGLDLPYLLFPGKDAYGMLMMDWQDVLYYRSIG